MVKKKVANYNTLFSYTFNQLRFDINNCIPKSHFRDSSPFPPPPHCPCILLDLPWKDNLEDILTEKEHIKVLDY